MNEDSSVLSSIMSGDSRAFAAAIYAPCGVDLPGAVLRSNSDWKRGFDSKQDQDVVWYVVVSWLWSEGRASMVRCRRFAAWTVWVHEYVLPVFLPPVLSAEEKETHTLSRAMRSYNRLKDNLPSTTSSDHLAYYMSHEVFRLEPEVIANIFGFHDKYEVRSVIGLIDALLDSSSPP
jgi:hypothetical protein